MQHRLCKTQIRNTSDRSTQTHRLFRLVYLALFSEQCQNKKVNLYTSNNHSDFINHCLLTTDRKKNQIEIKSNLSECNFILSQLYTALILVSDWIWMGKQSRFHFHDYFMKITQNVMFKGIITLEPFLQKSKSESGLVIRLCVLSSIPKL